MNSGMAGHYPRPVQFFQQVDFPTIPSYNDLTGLMDIATFPQSCSTSHHLTTSIDNSSSNCGQSVNEYASTRPLSDFCRPSTSTFTGTAAVQGLPGNFIHFQHFPNQVVLRENSYHSAGNKIHQFTKPPWFNNNQPLDNAGSVNELVVAENAGKGKKPLTEKTKRVRNIKPGCSNLCRRCCKRKISQSMREDLFNKYWNLGDDAKKKEFIAQNAIKMPMMKCKEGSRRSFSVDWAFSIKGESFSVCKLFFLHTLDIPENTAYAAIKDSQFFNSNTPVITSKAQEKFNSKPPTWFETDLDDYSFLERKGKYSRKARYESFTKNDRFTEMGPGCSNLCRRNCQSKFTQRERLAIFNEYRSLSNIRKQREYISKYINRMERKRVRAGESTRRGCSIQWNLSSKGKEIPVCKTFFLHTIGISERAAYNIGLQNQILPVERAVKRTNRSSSILSGKGKSYNSILAKEKLKSAIKLSRRKKKAVKYVSDTEDDKNNECLIDSHKNNHRKSVQRGKGGKQKGQKRKIVLDKTVKFKKATLDKSSKVEIRNEEHQQAKPKSGPCMKASTRLLKLPLRKGDDRKQRIPALRINNGKVFRVLRKCRNPYKRKEVPMKHTYSLCPENCRKKCQQNLSEDARKEIFHEFWSLKNMEEQRKYIGNCVKKVAKPTCTCLVASHLRGKRRGYTIAWNLNLRGLDIAVCKTFFMHVLQVSDSVVYKAVRESESFMSEVTPQPCKHFTGHNQVPEPSAADLEITKTTDCHVTSQDSQEARKQECLDNIKKENGANEQTREATAVKMDTSGTSKEMGSVDKMCYSKLTQIPGTSMSVSCNTGSGSQTLLTNDQHAQGCQKVHPPVPHFTKSDLCHIKVKYETLIPVFNTEQPQDSGQTVQVNYPTQQVTAYGPSEKLTSILHSTQAPISNTNVSHNDLWQKPGNTFHPMFNNNPPMFPTMADPRLDPGHNFSHPKELSPHFTFPQNGTHHSYYSVPSNSTGHHSTSFAPLYPNLSAPHVNYTNHKDFTNDVIGDLYHSTRFHNFTTPVVMPRQCVPNSSNYPVATDQGYHSSLMIQALRNTNSDTYVPIQNKPPKSRKKKKLSSSAKLKQDTIKMQRVNKSRVMKPFTKCIKAGCVVTCKRKCGQKVPEEARKQIFNEFWSLENDRSRREYVLPIVNKVPKKTCSGVNSRRCCTIEWCIPYKGERQVVCKRFFLDTFDIGEKFVKTIFDKVERKGGSMEDLRGRHCKRSNVFVKEQVEIEKQIRSVCTLKDFRCVSCKTDYTRWCLGSGLILSQLYKLYADQRKLEGKKPACRTSYTDLCNKKFDLKSSTQKESLCDACTPNADSCQNTTSDFHENF